MAGKPASARAEETAEAAAVDEAATQLRRALAVGDAEGLVAAAAWWRRLGSVVPTSAREWPRVMVMLCVALQGRFQVTGELADLDEAVDAGRRGIAAISGDDPTLAELLVSFASALRLRFDNSGRAGRHDADEAVAIYRQAIAATPEGRPERAGILASLGLALGSRLAAFPAEHDIGEAGHARR